MSKAARIFAPILLAACTGMAGEINPPALHTPAAPIANMSLDAGGPVIRTPVSPAILRPANGKIVPIEISGTITDDVSGVDPDKVSYCVSDEYGRIQPKGAIVLGPGGAYAFIVRLEARRIGGDRDGRAYVVRINATNRAGHSSQAAITILVPHDSQSR